MAEDKQQDAIALLKQDHRTVEELFEKFEKASGDGRSKASPRKSVSTSRSMLKSRKRFSIPRAKARSTRTC